MTGCFLQSESSFDAFDLRCTWLNGAASALPTADNAEFAGGVSAMGAKDSLRSLVRAFEVSTVLPLVRLSAMHASERRKRRLAVVFAIWD